MNENNLLAIAQALHQQELQAANLSEMSHPEPDDEQELYEEFLEFADPELAIEILDKLGKFEQWRRAMRDAIMKERAAQEEAAKPKKYSKPTQVWREKFAGIQDRAREAFANLEPSAWERVYFHDSNPTMGASTRNWILKNKDDYLMPGVWLIRSRQVIDPKSGREGSETLARYMADAMPDFPTEVTVLANPRGRQRNDPSLPNYDHET